MSGAKAGFSFPNFQALDALRGLLAVYVLAGHARWLLWAGNAKWQAEQHSLWADFLTKAGALLRYGHEAVIVFFVLSGFFIHLKAAQQLATGASADFSPRKFAQRRITRLLPPYALALLLTVCADLLGRWIFGALYAGTTGDPLLDTNFLRKDFSLAAVLPALLGMPCLLGKDFGSNGPLWSLGYEVVYYALYPLWLLVRKRSLSLAYVLPCGLAALLVALPSLGFPTAVLKHYPLWIAGAALAEIAARRQFKYGTLAVLAPVLFPIGALLLNHDARLPIYMVAGCGTVVFFATRSKAFLGNPVIRLFERLGLASYSIYIMHFPLLTLCTAVVFASFGARPMHGWFVLGGIIFSVGVSYLAFLACERHFLHRGSRAEAKAKSSGFEAAAELELR